MTLPAVGLYGEMIPELRDDLRVRWTVSHELGKTWLLYTAERRQRHQRWGRPPYFVWAQVQAGPAEELVGLPVHEVGECAECTSRHLAQLLGQSERLGPGRWRIGSFTTPGRSYLVEAQDSFGACDCLRNRNGNGPDCKHIDRVRELEAAFLAEREEQLLDEAPL